MEKRLFAPNAIPLDQLLRENGLAAAHPCGGRRSCGKCKAVVRGTQDSPSPEELRLLTPEELQRGVRLSCCAHVSGEIFVELPSLASAAIRADALAAEAEDRLPGEGYGAVVDIGTTTVVCALYGPDGALLGTESQLNCQQIYGADVISRIARCAGCGAEELHRAILRQTEDMLAILCRRCRISRAQLQAAVVTGNTTMLHFFAGLDPTGIGTAPFTPQSLFGTVDRQLLPGVDVYLPPCISGYVGADITCCLLFSSLQQREEPMLLIDIGTNGEIVLSANGSLTCCSTAAGPAFEGCGISWGSIARDGAICSVSGQRDRHSLAYSTVGSAPASSICGSGVIEALSAFLSLGLMEENGLLREDDPFFRRLFTRSAAGLSFHFPNCPVCLTQEDVRQIQLAKAAVLGGIHTLLDACALPAEHLRTLCLCGGFGSSLNPAAAEDIGLIPPGTARRTAVLGNAALKGAALALFSQRRREELQSLACSCRYIELSTDERFMDHYVAAMSFPSPLA